MIQKVLLNQRDGLLELNKLKAKGWTATDVAKEIINRDHNDDTDEAIDNSIGTAVNSDNEN